MSDFRRPDIRRIEEFLNSRYPESVLAPDDINFLCRLIDGIHAGHKAVLIVGKDPKNSDVLSYMFSSTSPVEAFEMMNTVIKRYIK